MSRINISHSHQLGMSATGSTQIPLEAAAQSQGVVTNSTLATVATIQQKFGEPAESSDLTAANCCLVIKRSPTYNLVLTPIVGHATAPADLWGECYVVGVRELNGRNVNAKKYIRTVMALLKFQGSSSTFTPSSTNEFAGLGDAPTLAVWSGCDVIGSTAYVPSPGIMELGEVTNGWGSFAFDGWSFPWIELYPSRSVPTGESGSTASGISFWYSQC